MAIPSNLWSDLRYAGRSLGRNPGFAAAAILTIALGVGVNTGIFTVLNGVLFRDLPAPDPHELVSISQTVEGGHYSGVTGTGTFTISEYRAYREGARTLSGLLAHSDLTAATLGGDAPQEIYGTLVSCNYLEVLRQPPLLGRGLTAQDCESGAEPVIVLSHDLWTTAFAAEPMILGRTLELNRQQLTIVGVASETTYTGSPLRVGYFAPLSAEPLLRTQSRYEDDRSRWLYLVGRRSQRAGLEQIRAELGVIAAQIDALEPGRSTTVAVGRAKPMTVPSGSRAAATAAAAVLMTAFGAILLIACANVANLLLARGTVRSEEIGIRLSLGASRARIVRQLLTESMLISLAGGLLGSMLALQSFQALVALALPALVPPELSASFALGLDFTPDHRVLLFAVGLTFAAGALFGLLPALHVSQQDLHAMIRQDAAGAGTSPRGGRLRGTLVGVQVALCMMLMIATGLLLRGLYATYTVDPGFDYRDVTLVSLGLSGARYEPERAAVLRQRLRDEVEALPGVDAVAYGSRAPLSEERVAVAMRLAERSDDEWLWVQMNQVGPGYFSVLGIPIVSGRTFTESEAASTALAGGTSSVIVTETTARYLWAEGDPIGRTLVWGDSALQVVGVAADAQVTGLGEIEPYYAYLPGAGDVLLIKSRTDAGAMAAAIRAFVQTLDPSLVVHVLPLEAILGWRRGVSVIVTTLGAGLGALALALASVGIYGVVAYSVTRRYREIGIRMALGATARDLLRMILRQTMRPVVVGAVIGIAAASALSSILSSVLFGVSPADPIGLGGAALLVLAVSLAAGVMAARPATRADPTATLRYE